MHGAILRRRFGTGERIAGTSEGNLLIQIFSINVEGGLDAHNAKVCGSMVANAISDSETFKLIAF